MSAPEEESWFRLEYERAKRNNAQLGPYGIYATSAIRMTVARILTDRANRSEGGRA